MMKRPQQRRSLGFGVPISPSPDPVSLALDAVAGFVMIFSAFQARKNARQAQENEVVQVQNKLGTALDPISAAARDPNISAADLATLGNEVEGLGKDFYNYTLGFQTAGPGARQTIFGDEVTPGQFVSTAAHPGWLTQLLDSIKRKIGEKTGVTPQLGDDWTSIIPTLETTAVNIVKLVTGGSTPQYTIGPGGNMIPANAAAQNAAAAAAQQSIPSWVWPAGLGLVALLVVSNVFGGRR